MDTSINAIGFRSGVSAFIATVAFTVVQLLQLLGILHYPWDEILIYGTSLCIVVPFIIEMLALHYMVPASKKIWSHAGLIFTVIYAIFVTANYVVQLAPVIPMTINGRKEDIQVLVQSPHSLFWNSDAIGYVSMGPATLFAGPAFGKEGFEKKVRIAFLIHGMVTTPLISFVYFYPGFSNKLLLLGLPWSVTAPACMLLLALLFKKELMTNLADSK